ncbi:MAG: hypothetical protein H7327_02445 [Herminiimonas sp.]|nr:hypothetical protein [Herminiimonas sp.]
MHFNKKVKFSLRKLKWPTIIFLFRNTQHPFFEPGEVASQVWQRYKQTDSGAMLSAGVLMPGVDLGLHADAVPGQVETPHPTALVVSGDIAAAAALPGTRLDKAKNRQAYEQRRGALKPDWTIPAGSDGKSIDLSHTGAFGRMLHSRAERVWRFIRIIPQGLFLSERAALSHTARTLGKKACARQIAGRVECVVRRGGSLASAIHGAPIDGNAESAFPVDSRCCPATGRRKAHAGRSVLINLFDGSTLKLAGLPDAPITYCRIERPATRCHGRCRRMARQPKMISPAASTTSLHPTLRTCRLLPGSAA